MKKFVLIILLMVMNVSFALNKENTIVDSLKTALTKTKNDTTRVKILNELSKNNFYRTPKIGIKYSTEALQLARKINWKKGIAQAYTNLGICYWVNANHQESINNFKKSAKLLMFIRCVVRY